MRRTEAIAAVAGRLNDGHAFVVETTRVVREASISRASVRAWKVFVSFHDLGLREPIVEYIGIQYQAIYRFLELLVSEGVMTEEFMPVDEHIMERDGFWPDLDLRQGRDYIWCKCEQERRNARPADCPRRRGDERLYR